MPYFQYENDDGWEKVTVTIAVTQHESVAVECHDRVLGLRMPKEATLIELADDAP